MKDRIADLILIISGALLFLLAYMVIRQDYTRLSSTIISVAFAFSGILLYVGTKNEN